MSTMDQTNRPQFRFPQPRVVEVLRVTKLVPHMVRLTFGGEQLEGFATKGVAEHIRIYLPDAQSGELVLPVLRPDGFAFPVDRDRPVSRAYTPRRWDPRNQELDVDVVIHGDGPGSVWASNVKAGDTAVISGQPGGAYLPETHVDWYVIGGDEAALPAIGTLTEALPPSMQSYVFIEVLNKQEEQELTSPSQMQVTWLYRNTMNSSPGRKLAEAMQAVKLPTGDGRIWVSCEAGVMRDIRKHFLDSLGIDRSMLRTQGYWKAGETNHTDHDMGEDV